MSYDSVMHHALTAYYDGDAELSRTLMDRREAEVRSAVLREAADKAFALATEMRSGDGDYCEEWSSRDVRDAVSTVGAELRSMAEEGQ